jgi:hypothetical protein
VRGLQYVAVGIAMTFLLAACAEKKVEDMNLAELGTAYGKEICKIYAPDGDKPDTARAAVDQLGKGFASLGKLGEITAAAAMIAKDNPEQSVEFTRARERVLDSCPAGKAGWARQGS